MQSVLTIAGFDPSSGAGATADLMVFAAHGLFGTSCLTSLTVQSTVGVRDTHAIESKIVRATLECLRGDLPPAGIKIGMLATAANVVAVAEFLGELREEQERVRVVLDPVFRSSSGRRLLEPEGVALLRDRLLPLVDWVTPNFDELGVLTGHEVEQRDDVPAAARALQERYERLNVLATGGDLDPPDDLVLTTAGAMHWLTGEHVASRSTHGTGCALSSALLCRLVRGDAAVGAAVGAKAYVAEAIRSATPMGKGHGPVNLLWPLRKE